MDPLFYIVVAGGASGLEGQRLTNGRHVTILPPGGGGAVPDPEQEWQVGVDTHGNLTIRRPGDFVPPPYLTYNGVPEPPQQGDRVVVKDHAPSKWHGKIGPGFKSPLRVVGSDLGIALSPLTIFPPFLALSHKDQVEWSFVPVPVPDE